jgi:hypothetical protein
MASALHILGAATILAILFVYRTSTTWPELIIVLLRLPVFRVAPAQGVATLNLQAEENDLGARG